jgi:hypothetical protein
MTEALGYRIEINCENAAFGEGEIFAETARILRDLAKHMERGNVGECRKLCDSNGNTCGEIVALF